MRDQVSPWTRPLGALLVVGLMLTACGGGGGAAKPGSPQAPTPVGTDAGGGFNYDRTVVAFCVGQERVVAIEARLLKNEPAPEEAVPLLAEARKDVLNTLQDLKAGGRTDLIPAVKRWAHSFQVAQKLARRGASALDTLRPVRKELLNVDRIQSCELDNDL